MYEISFVNFWVIFCDRSSYFKTLKTPKNLYNLKSLKFKNFSFKNLGFSNPDSNRNRHRLSQTRCIARTPSKLFCSVCGLNIMLLHACIKMHQNVPFLDERTSQFSCWGAQPAPRFSPLLISQTSNGVTLMCAYPRNENPGTKFTDIVLRFILKMYDKIILRQKL